ncbi:unnamed protein product, partial [Symbiodinium necroappetens]
MSRLMHSWVLALCSARAQAPSTPCQATGFLMPCQHQEYQEACRSSAAADDWAELLTLMEEDELEESTSRQKEARTNTVRWSWLHVLVMSVALLGLCILMGIVMDNMRSSGRDGAEARLALWPEPLWSNPCAGSMQVSGLGTVPLINAKYNLPSDPAGNVWMEDAAVVIADKGRTYWGTSCNASGHDENFDPSGYIELHLLGKRLEYTTHINGVGCGCNAALYLVSMSTSPWESACEAPECSCPSFSPSIPCASTVMSFIDASTVAQQLTDALSAARHMAYAPVVAAVGDQVADLNDAASAANLLQQDRSDTSAEDVQPSMLFVGCAAGEIAGTTSQTAAPAALGTFQESDDIDVEDQASLQRCTWWGATPITKSGGRSLYIVHHWLAPSQAQAKATALLASVGGCVHFDEIFAALRVQAGATPTREQTATVPLGAATVDGRGKAPPDALIPSTTLLVMTEASTSTGPAVIHQVTTATAEQFSTLDRRFRLCLPVSFFWVAAVERLESWEMPAAPRSRRRGRDSRRLHMPHKIRMERRARVGGGGGGPSSLSSLWRLACGDLAEVRRKKEAGQFPPERPHGATTETDYWFVPANVAGDEDIAPPVLGVPSSSEDEEELLADPAGAPLVGAPPVVVDMADVGVQTVHNVLMPAFDMVDVASQTDGKIAFSSFVGDTPQAALAAAIRALSPGSLFRLDGALRQAHAQPLVDVAPSLGGGAEAVPVPPEINLLDDTPVGPPSSSAGVVDPGPGPAYARPEPQVLGEGLDEDRHWEAAAPMQHSLVGWPTLEPALEAILEFRREWRHNLVRIRRDVLRELQEMVEDAEDDTDAWLATLPDHVRATYVTAD